jgi:two-component system, chemotaxis family, chemotaxis protein CheY
VNELQDEEIITRFVTESLDLLETAIEPDLLALERDGALVSPGIIINLFRVLNNIKEIADMLGFEAIKTLSSAMEELFVLFMLFRDEKLVPDPDKIDVLFAGVDKLKMMFQDIDGSAYVPYSDELERIYEILESQNVTRILVVDDEFVSRKKAQKILSQYGECYTAANGTEALEAFRLAHEEGKPYNLITMDIQMPDMDGIETLERIRKWEESHNIEFVRRAKVLMLTATEAKDALFKSFRKGCEAYILKPFDREKLTNALCKFWDT